MRTRQALGKYRIEKCLWDGNYSAVYRGYDTIEGVRVAMKIPHLHMMDDDFLEDFRREVRLASRLDHEHVLRVKNASFIGEFFVMVYPLGEETLGDRIQRRLSLKTILELGGQAIEAVAHAHSHRIIHSDIKPENFILFPGPRVRLTDFGISKSTMRTMDASGGGTVGYMAPEQAMGRLSFRSDVFALGLVLCRMLSGELPDWPYEWPPPGFARLKRRAHPELIAVLRKALEVNPARRYRDAGQMLAAFSRVKTKALAFETRSKRGRSAGKVPRDWRLVRFDQFRRTHAKGLGARHECGKCSGPVSEAMRWCPWCGDTRKKHKGETTFPVHCPRCERGVKLDWRFCAWCFGKAFEDITERTYRDKRYEASCSNPACKRKQLMPFMKYCPWCRSAVTRKWKIEGSRDRCGSCGWGVVKAFWVFCPWCGKRVAHK